MSRARTLAGAVDDVSRAAAVRATVAATRAGDRVGEQLTKRQGALGDAGERGAQAAEYAMLGGVAAAGCGTMVVVLQEQQDSLGDQIGDWIGQIFEFASGFLGS